MREHSVQPKRYPLRQSQLKRIRQFQHMLKEVVPLRELIPGQVATVEQALACGAMLVHGTLEQPQTTRWLAPDNRRAAAYAAKALQRRAQVLQYYRDKGLAVRETDWRYETRHPVGEHHLFFSTRTAFDPVFPSHAVLRKKLAVARRRVRLMANLMTSTVTTVTEGLSNLARQYPTVANLDSELEALHTELRIRKFKDDFEAHLTRYLHKRARDLRKKFIQASPDVVELHVSAIRRTEGYTVVCLALKLPGQKVRLTFRTARKRVEHTVALYLRTHYRAIANRPVIVYAREELQDAIAAQEEFDSARMLVTQPKDSRVKDAASRYCTTWERSIPCAARLEHAARPVKPISHLKAMVYTDASQHQTGNGLASVLYLRGQDKPVIVYRQTADADTPVLEARALIMGLEAMEQEQPGHSAKFLTDNQGVVFAIEAFRDTGVPGKVLLDALGHRSTEWLKERVARHRFGWVPSHSGIAGNELADRHARIGRTATGPLWV